MPFGREIASSQDDLRSPFSLLYQIPSSAVDHLSFPAMLSRVQTVQKEVEKLAAGNETLQMYIDNLTVQMAKRG